MGVETMYIIKQGKGFNNIKVSIAEMGEKEIRGSEKRKKEDNSRILNDKREESKNKETEKSTAKQKKNDAEDRIKEEIAKIKEEKAKKEVKLETIIEDAEKKNKENREEEENIKHIYGVSLDGKKLDYDYIFSYLGSRKEKKSDVYSELNGGKTDELADSSTAKEIMDIKEQKDYAIRQAANFLVGTGMNHISYEEKERFSAFMSLPSNKIIFLINYAMTGMNYVIAQPVVHSKSMQNYEIKLTNSEIKEKSMKNDILITLRFDTKGSGQKSYVK
jgi:hypothetical protein